MKCRNCGEILAPGQLICSSCDFDNSGFLTENSVIQNVNNNDFSYNEHQNEFVNSVDSFDDVANDSNQTTIKNDSNKKGNKKIIIIVLSIILIPVIVVIALAIMMAGLQTGINNSIDESSNDSFINQYQIIRREVKMNIAYGVDVICSYDCTQKYGIEGADMEITRVNNYYKIEIKADSNGKYSKVNINNSDCKSIENTVCNGATIIGRVYDAE